MIPTCSTETMFGFCVRIQTPPRVKRKGKNLRGLQLLGYTSSPLTMTVL